MDHPHLVPDAVATPTAASPNQEEIEAQVCQSQEAAVHQTGDVEGQEAVGRYAHVAEVQWRQ